MVHHQTICVQIQKTIDIDVLN